MEIAQQSRTIDDLMLEIMTGELRIRAKMDRLRNEIEESLASFDKVKFMNASSKLQQFETSYNR
jgi:hypothetical protein